MLPQDLIREPDENHKNIVGSKRPKDHKPSLQRLDHEHHGHYRRGKEGRAVNEITGASTGSHSRTRQEPEEHCGIETVRGPQAITRWLTPPEFLSIGMIHTLSIKEQKDRPLPWLLALVLEGEKVAGSSLFPLTVLPPSRRVIRPPGGGNVEVPSKQVPSKKGQVSWADIASR